jgi:hypothetical protein
MQNPIIKIHTKVHENQSAGSKIQKNSNSKHTHTHTHSMMTLDAYAFI